MELSTKANFRSRAYPWLISVSGLIILVIINGLSTSSISIFDEPLLKEFGWERGTLKFREFITFGVAAVLIFFAGALIDRYGVKQLLLFGTTCMLLALFSYSRITAAWQMYLIHVLMALSVVSSGSVAVVILISTWFKEKRGMAIGIALIGTSLGGVVLPPLQTRWIELYGWRNTFLLETILPLTLLVYIYLIIKNSPDEIGSLAYGQSPEKKDSSENQNLLQTGMEYKDALKTLNFWLIAVCGMLTFYCITGLSSHTVLHIRGLGYDKIAAANALSLFFLMSLSGKFIISAISDYLNVYRVFSFCFFGMFLGAAGYFSMNESLVFGTIALAALSWGGIYTLYNIIIIKSFGLKAAGKINGSISVLESVGAATGPWLTGILFDYNQNYRLAFGIITGIMLLSFLISLNFKSGNNTEKTKSI